MRARIAIGCAALVTLVVFGQGCNALVGWEDDYVLGAGGTDDGGTDGSLPPSDGAAPRDGANGGDGAASCTPTSCPHGCCDDNGVCQAGTADNACGTNGATCGPCSGTNKCLGGKCGCQTTADCPKDQACDVGTHTCGNDCVVGGVTLACNTGCCDANGSMLCVSGAAGGTLCGVSGGVCTDCSKSADGHVCQLGGVCGCAKAADCPTGNACDPTTHKCSASCAGGLACNGGCCDGSMCQAGTAPMLCGSGGGACADCSASAAGHACINGACGCVASSDCASPATCGGGGTPGVCGCTPATCTAGQCGDVPDGCGGVLSCGNCNGAGCCTATHVCVAGTTNTACGGGGATCRSCGGTTPLCGSINGAQGCYCRSGVNDSCASLGLMCDLATGMCQ